MSSHLQSEAEPTTRRTGVRPRAWVLLAIFLALLLLALVPPYFNVNRLQRRITTSISASLGRPVHLDNVTLNLLPIPGFTLDNFVVSEDPAFGSEPTIRANTVTARLRVSTLWRRRIEFSRITFTDPSVNLVHTSDGKWNLDSILLQAAHIRSAPTAQTAAGPAPRFPYIEATGARLNLKLDTVKTPFSLTEADFALWLSDPETWHFRITARPARTDVPVAYSGVLHLEGTLGRAPTLAQIPLDLRGEWRTAPLGEVSRIFLGRDAGWRGDMTLNASAHGTVGSNDLTAAVLFNDLRRIDFVPAHPLTVSAACAATAKDAFISIPKLQCAAPPDTAQPIFTLTASVDNLRRPVPSTLNVVLNPLPASTLVPLLQVFSRRIPPQLQLGGTLGGSFHCDAPPCDLAHLQGSLTLRNASIQADPDTPPAISLGPITLSTTTPGTPNQPDTAALFLAPSTISLGAATPALLDGHIDLSGLTLHLSGPATPASINALESALPQFGDGFPQPQSPASSSRSPAPLHLDLTATHPWTGQQVWQPTPAPSAPRSRSARRHR